MRFEMSDIKSITLCDYVARTEVECDITDKLEIKTHVETKVPVELMKQIDSQRLNYQLIYSGIIDITLSFNCIIRADLNNVLEESFNLDEVYMYQLDNYKKLPYSVECKNPVVTNVEYDLGQSELESNALLLDFAEVFNEVPSLYSELVNDKRYVISIDFNK